MKRSFQPFALALLLLALFGCTAQPAFATTWYVRSDGGTSAQCTGKTDAAYPGKGSAQACAFNNPQWAIPPGYSGDGVKPVVLQSGDTLQIASGTYQVGYGSPGATACQSSYPYNCVYNPRDQVPLPANITIAGNCAAPPELWAGGGAYNVFNLSGTVGVTIKCLTLTDHSNCIYGTFSGLPKCVANGNGQVTATNGQDGIDVHGASNLTLQHLLIHGFPYNGIMAGELTGTTTVDNVILRANASAGWNGDLGGNGTNSTNGGTLLFTNDSIEWNGCTENYPATTITGCRAAEQGGYGDGLGTALTGGAWRIINSKFRHNTSDGLDLLYADGTGSIFVDRVTSEFNAGQQVKVAAPATVQNSVINGDCAEFTGLGLLSSEQCRASGNAVELDFTAAGQAITFANNTLTGNGDCLLVSGPASAAPNYVPAASNTVTISNSIMLGQVSHLGKNSGGDTCAFYSNGAPTLTWPQTIVWNTRNTDFTTKGMIHADPLLANETLANFDATPTAKSPALGAGANCTAVDWGSQTRATKCTIGAIETTTTPKQPTYTGH
jgi:hypothetical protein